ncbi:hypothetical protein CEXT_65251 [Caerostris extrusa]|uniref:Uncharacterized protein n=1 Tax=Caerostris extrusa TaxID=172846 RepID=A0AAV4UWY6_CAEEX|nr:hypothetical protein CEXT_65251 [Caerostris extrusa]
MLSQRPNDSHREEHDGSLPDPLYPPEQYSDVIRTLNLCSGIKPLAVLPNRTIQPEISQGNSMSFVL